MSILFGPLTLNKISGTYKRLYDRQSHLIMVGEVRVGDGDPGRALNGVDEAVSGVGHGDVIDPDILGPEERYPIAITSRAEAVVVDRVPNHATFLGNNVVDPQAMDDHIAHELNSYPSAVGNVDPDAAPVDGLVSLHDHFLLECDHHVAIKYDPQRLLLDHCVAQSPRSRV